MPRPRPAVSMHALLFSVRPFSIWRSREPLLIIFTRFRRLCRKRIISNSKFQLQNFLLAIEDFLPPNLRQFSSTEFIDYLNSGCRFSVGKQDLQRMFPLYVPDFPRLLCGHSCIGRSLMGINGWLYKGLFHYVLSC